MGAVLGGKRMRRRWRSEGRLALTSGRHSIGRTRVVPSSAPQREVNVRRRRWCNAVNRTDRIPNCCWENVPVDSDARETEEGKKESERRTMIVLRFSCLR